MVKLWLIDIIKAFILIAFPSLLFAQKNDTVYLLNGDRFTGELKKLEYGLIYLKTDAMQTINIEYDRIQTIYSAKFFELRTSTGFRYYGFLAKSTVKGAVNIITANDTIPKPIADIVEITSIKKSFFKKMDGSVDAGLSYTKASEVFQYNLAANITYRTPKYSTEFDLSSILTDQKEDITRKNDIGLGVTRLLPGKWLAGVQVKGQQNTELDLDKRWQGGFGIGYDLVRTNSNRFNTLAGLFVNYEKTIDSAIVTNNLEGLIALQYKWFQYRHPKIDVTSSFDFFPSFTVPGRYRIEYELNGKFEIITDLFFSISIYDNFDSKPSGSESSKNDWGVITSIGYSF
ncbi:MAG: DUF481 domain-containing protein [Bacteroidales bacterium]|nr:DUF481 domain-containing protein [Bacteroidales bacterium]